MEEPELGPGSAAYFGELESQGPSLLIVALVGLLVIAGVGTGTAYWVTEKRGMNGLSIVERAYMRMWHFAAWLGVPAPPDQTPYERAGVLTALVPKGDTPITHITGMYSGNFHSTIR